MSWKVLSSGKLTTSQLVYTGPCFYFGFACVNSGASFDVVIYDNTEASGHEIEDFLTDVNNMTEGHVHNSPITCSNGIYLSLGGGSAIVYYTPLREGVQ